MDLIRNLISLSGKTSLITGASGRLGSVMACALAELGSDLILVDIVKEKLEIDAQKIASTYGVEVSTHIIDLELENERVGLIKSVISSGAELDILINNAAFVGSTKLDGWVTEFQDQSIDVWRRAIEVNLTAPFHLAQGLTPILSRKSQGVIINIGSIYAHLGPDWRLYDGLNMGNPAAYSASKGGLMQITRWLATTLAPNIRVNAISPGVYLITSQMNLYQNMSRRPPWGEWVKQKTLLAR